MNLFFRKILPLFILACSVIPGIAQTVMTGKVLSATDSLPISGASIYFDGTSIGVSSGDDGSFRIKNEDNISSVLIINALGYKTHLIQDHLEKSDLGSVFLEEALETLGEVHLETDPWSRQKKLNIFRREFLGHTRASLQCKIQNEDAITLRYIPSRETLIAYADEPLDIVNKYLGYQLTYNLTDFKVEFSTGSSGLQFPQVVYYEGFSFFEELRKKPSRRFLKNREETFKGSSLHFMRSLATRKLTENGFRIFYDKFEVLPYTYFRINPMRDLTEVEILKDKLSIVYGPLTQSAIHGEGKFYIDNNGNFTPPQNVMFSGMMGVSRVAGMLPLNYNL